MLGEISIDSRFSGLVQKLIEVEKKPMENMQSRQNKVKDQLSNYGVLKNSISNFTDEINKINSVEKFNSYKAVSSLSESVKVTADSTAMPSEYKIHINQLAQQNIIASTGFADKTAAIGQTGEIQLTSGANTFNVTIDNSNNSLSGIRDAINNNADNNSISASIINVNDVDGSSISKLILTAKNSGTQNSITLTNIVDDVLSTINVTTQLQVASNAEFTIDNMSVIRNDNVISDVIDGVTFTLLKDEGSEVLISVVKDNDAIVKNIKSLVESYNVLMDNISNVGSNGNTRVLKNQLQSALHEPNVGLGRYMLLSEIGLSVNSKTGQMVLDENDLNLALNDNYMDVINLLSDSNDGFMKKFEDLGTQFLKSDGTIQSTISSLNVKIKRFDQSIEKMQLRLKESETRYVKQFSLLDSIVTQFEKTSEYLIKQMDSIQNAGSRK